MLSGANNLTEFKLILSEINKTRESSPSSCSDPGLPTAVGIIWTCEMLVAITSLREGRFLSKWVEDVYLTTCSSFLLPMPVFCFCGIMPDTCYQCEELRWAGLLAMPTSVSLREGVIGEKGLWNLFSPIGRQEPGKMLRIYRCELQRWAMPNLFLVCFPGPSYIHWSNLGWTLLYSCLCSRHWGNGINGIKVAYASLTRLANHICI